ncbi:hypothetical protein NEDG_00834 [Nematocida displodere]|uniref:Uncharacterized protein n=1 Tax=Nematocida displodere TaxID=1805483 RepID=A0A177EDW9_9MICR|nr:hypothetical protein NEDG_00834 [Nematocida displodere]
MKRVRAKRIENDKKVNVLYEKEIDPACLQEYSGAIFTTGVEREEEEEHHLKEVISGRGENIPTPQAAKVHQERVKRQKLTESASLTEAERPENYLKDAGDVLNAFVGFEDQPPTPVQEILRQESQASPALQPYVCFRKREVKSLRKARKPDTSIEKIKKIKVDLQMIRRLAELTMQRDAYLAQHLSSILSIFNICREMNKRLDIGVLSISESILRDILFTKLISKNDKFFKKIPSFTNLYTCRKSIGSLRKLFKSGPPKEEEIVLTKKEIDHLNEY